MLPKYDDCENLILPIWIENSRTQFLKKEMVDVEELSCTDKTISTFISCSLLLSILITFTSLFLIPGMLQTILKIH